LRRFKTSWNCADRSRRFIASLTLRCNLEKESAAKTWVGPIGMQNQRGDAGIKVLSAVAWSPRNQRTTPQLNGEVSRIAADLTQDQKSGLSYYVVRIAVSPACASWQARAGAGDADAREKGLISFDKPRNCCASHVPKE
jgi:hypothetical protein